jgi:hypothetical protein
MRRKAEKRVEEYWDRALGSVIREVWTEGPRAPSPEYLIAALRPAMATVDAERASAPLWERALDHMASWTRPASAALLSGAAAVALFLLLPTSTPVAPDVAPRGGVVADSGAAIPGAEPVAFSQQMPALFEDGVALNVGVPQSIYDLAQGENPLMLFEADDGATVIWVLGKSELSGGLPLAGGWA